MNPINPIETGGVVGLESRPEKMARREGECVFEVGDPETKREIELAVRCTLPGSAQTDNKDVVAAVWEKISKRKQVNRTFIRTATKWVVIELARQKATREGQTCFISIEEEYKELEEEDGTLKDNQFSEFSDSKVLTPEDRDDRLLAVESFQLFAARNPYLAQFIQLLDVEGLSKREAAKILKLPETRVWRYHRKAKKELQRIHLERFPCLL